MESLCHAQAVEELNIKPKYWKDLLDDTPFTRKDIIHLQDPLNLQVLHSSCQRINRVCATCPLKLLVALIAFVKDH